MSNQRLILPFLSRCLQAVILLPIVIALVVAFLFIGFFCRLLGAGFPSGSIASQVIAEIIHDAIQGIWSRIFGPPKRRIR